MATSKKKVQKKTVKKKAIDFYKKYNISSVDITKNEILKPNGNFKYIWDFKSSSNTSLTTTIY